jgi:hypothetical protein
MENGIPLIKKFRTEKNYYIYDTWTNEILNVHKDFWDYLPDVDNPRVDEKAVGQSANLAEVQSEVEKAQKLGYLSTERPEVATYYGWPNWKEEMANEINHNLQQLVLNVTEVCNFRCTYCAYSGFYPGNRVHSSKQMPWEIARKSIEYAIEHSDYGAKNNRPLGISFYGGEPLCNFEVIKKSVLFCKEKFPQRDVRFYPESCVNFISACKKLLKIAMKTLILIKTLFRTKGVFYGYAKNTDQHRSQIYTSTIDALRWCLFTSSIFPIFGFAKRSWPCSQIAETQYGLLFF